MIGKKRKNTAKVKVDLTNYLEKGGYTGTAQDLKNELDNLSTKMNEATLTEVDLVELKKIAKGERFTINYADGEKLSVTAEELKKALKNKEVTEVILNTDGLEEYRFQYEKRYLSSLSYAEFKDIEDPEMLEKYNNSGVYIDIFDDKTKELVARNKFYLTEMFKSIYSAECLTIKIPVDTQYFPRFTKFGEYKDYELILKLGWEHNGNISRRDEDEIILYKEDDQGFLFEFGDTCYNSETAFKINFGKLKKVIFTNLFVNNKEVSKAQDFGILPMIGNRRGYRSDNEEIYSGNSFLDYIKPLRAIQVGDVFYQNIIEEMKEGSHSRKVLFLMNGNDNINGYKGIQLIDTETKKVVYENFNVTEKLLFTQDVQLPDTLTVKLFTEIPS